MAATNATGLEQREELHYWQLKLWQQQHRQLQHRPGPLPSQPRHRPREPLARPGGPLASPGESLPRPREPPHPHPREPPAYLRGPVPCPRDPITLSRQPFPFPKPLTSEPTTTHCKSITSHRNPSTSISRSHSSTAPKGKPCKGSPYSKTHQSTSQEGFAPSPKEILAATSGQGATTPHKEVSATAY
ncbi:hypothetical protein ACKKBG_A11385 [Auxenochlorella protothecoides x Auxenochlorella symbiontica]